MSFPNIPEASNDGSNSTYIMVTGANAQVLIMASTIQDEIALLIT